MCPATTTISPETYAVKSFMYLSFTNNINEGKVVDALDLMLRDSTFKYFDVKSRKDFIKFCKYQNLHDESYPDSYLEKTIELLLETCKENTERFNEFLDTEEGTYYAIKYKNLNKLDTEIIYHFMNFLDEGKIEKDDTMYVIDILLSFYCWPQNRPYLPIDISILHLIVHNSAYNDEEKLKVLKYFLYTDKKIDSIVFNTTIFGSNMCQQKVIDFLQTMVFNKINPYNLQTMAEVFTRNYSVLCLEYIIDKGYSGLAYVIRTYLGNISNHDNYTPKLIKLVLSKRPRKPSSTVIKLALEAKYDLMRYRDFYKNLNLSHAHIIESKIEDVDAIINHTNR